MAMSWASSSREGGESQRRARWMMARVTGLAPGEFVHTFGDVHLYLNHLDQADEQLKRKPRALPRMELNPEVRSLFDFVYEDFRLVGYDPHPAIHAKVAV